MSLQDVWVDKQNGEKIQAEHINELAHAVMENESNLANKASKATTLSGYGITDSFTKQETEEKIYGSFKNRGTTTTLPSNGMQIGDTYNMRGKGEQDLIVKKNVITQDIILSEHYSGNNVGYVAMFNPQDFSNLPASFTLNIKYDEIVASVTIKHGDPIQYYYCFAINDDNRQILGESIKPEHIQSITYKLSWRDGDNLSWTGYYWDKFSADNVYTKEESDDRYLPKRTVSGNPVSVSDQLADVPLIGCTVHGASGGVGDLVTDDDVNYGKYRIGIKAVGKQLFDKNDCQWVGGYFAPTVNPVATHAVARTVYIPCSPNTTYTISRSLELEVETDTGMQTVVNANSLYFGYTTEIPNVGVEVYNIKSGNVSATSLTLTTGEDAKYLVCYSFNGNYYAGYDVDKVFNAVIATIQIEIGSKVTQKEEYTENTVDVFLTNRLYEGKTLSIPKKLISPKSEKMNVFVGTETQPKQIDVQYYQDTSKVISELQKAVIALGGGI